MPLAGVGGRAACCLWRLDPDTPVSDFRRSSACTDKAGLELQGQLPLVAAHSAPLKSVLETGTVLRHSLDPLQPEPGRGRALQGASASGGGCRDPNPC